MAVIKERLVALPAALPLRRRARLGSWLVPGLTLCGALLAGCGSSPQVQLYQLRAEPPGVPASAPAAAASGRWVLAGVQLPDYLDRDALLLPTGRAGLQALPGQRWAEPLRDAVPRLLQQDLARLRGVDQVWRAPLPPGVTAQRQLRVEIQQFEAADAGLRQVLLAARWVLSDPSGQQPARVGALRLQAPLAEASSDALVAAHRQVLWQLAQAIAAQGDAP